MNRDNVNFSVAISSVRPRQDGYVVVTISVILLIAGILLSGSMRATHINEQTAGHAIQYNRAMEAAEGGVATAQKNLIEYTGSRRFADASASDGVFSLDSAGEKWWRDASTIGQHDVDADLLLGVAESPSYVYEQIGEYAADGGTGVVNLDIGGASYGSTSAGAREHILYKVEAHGVGSKIDVPRAIQTTVIITK